MEDHSFVQIDCRDLLKASKYLLDIAKSINENCNAIQENWREPEKAEAQMRKVLQDIGTDNKAFNKSIAHIQQFYESVSKRD